MKMNPVVHFEMPYTDNKRVAKFYKNVFGWGIIFVYFFFTIGFGYFLIQERKSAV